MAAIILFGGGGDLAMRMLLPSLYFLERDGLLADELKIIGAARSDEGRDEYVAKVRDAVQPRAESDNAWDEDVWRRMETRLDYLAVDATDAESLKPLKAKVGDDEVTSFLAVSPSLYGRIVTAMKVAGLAERNSRLVVEKPVGRDLKSFREIDDAVASAFREEQVFRIDHYLGKETVQNLIALRFGNTIFEPLWNNLTVDHVQITVGETVGVGDRWPYYDEYGALRDMLQNHLLQLLCLVAMEPPSDLDPDSVRNEKVKVLRSLRPITHEEAERVTVRGQYVAGELEGKPVKGYDDERGEPSDTETFVAVRADIDNWRWAGVPFYMRTGKRMPEKRTEIVIQFKSVPHSIFASGDRGEVCDNRLVIELQPEEDISLSVMNKRPGLERSMQLQPIKMSLSWGVDDKDARPPRRRIAYERLLLDAMNGDNTLFVRRDEAEQAWKWVDEVSEAWEDAAFKPHDYQPGTWGPDEAEMLLARTGRRWNTTDA
ncbi:glucose-6-phosphate dehydrogenase [Brevundimonas sp. PAMC22021]|uniref:glucose-6-phosphate dehydrogenase n=1 Tax=Brevundimonas sp. PAMC22021 TaxID=2861285 RepID=UPI001C6287BA|nr:glucose-6-phosphate dehydrogenase [Brevundimonas sp. PAMC22021]QYF86153.1 glucose-6-phosphate dehydrogenase [Brevundimonas sp. PAMC22021]